MDALRGFFMSKNEEVEYSVLEKFRQGAISRKEAAYLLGVSERSITRRVVKIRLRGLSGIKHGNYEKSPANKLKADVREKSIGLAKERYFDFNMSHCLEMLRDHHGLNPSYSTFRQWCRQENIGKRKKRRASKKRVYRERIANCGMLLQMDGSHHKWNGRDEWCLISLIDDATSELCHAEFFHGETTWNCLAALRSVIEKYGIPWAIYTDKAGWAGLGGKRDNFTQFVRVCAELGIKMIKASSPEAKGRIERSYQTIQDRLVPEMRLLNIKSMIGANQYLQQHFIPKYWDKRIVVEARRPENRFRPLDKNINLDEIFCFKYERSVRRDQTFFWANDLYKITSKEQGNLWNKNVVIHEDQKGQIQAYYSSFKLSVEKVRRPNTMWMRRLG